MLRLGCFLEKFFLNVGSCVVRILNSFQVKSVGSVEHHAKGGGHLVVWHWMEVGGHLHAAAVLPPRKELLVPIG